MTQEADKHDMTPEYVAQLIHTIMLFHHNDSAWEHITTEEKQVYETYKDVDSFQTLFMGFIQQACQAAVEEYKRDHICGDDIEGGVFAHWLNNR